MRQALAPAITLSPAREASSARTPPDDSSASPVFGAPTSEGSGKILTSSPCCPPCWNVGIVSAASNRRVGPSRFLASASQRRTVPSRHAAEPSAPGYNAWPPLRGLVVHSHGARRQLLAVAVAPKTQR